MHERTHDLIDTAGDVRCNFRSGKREYPPAKAREFSTLP